MVQEIVSFIQCYREEDVTMLPIGAFISRIMTDHRMDEKAAEAEWYRAKADTRVRREMNDGQLTLAYKGFKR